MCERDGGDLQVHRSDPKAQTRELLELGRGRRIEIEERNTAVVLNKSSQPGVGVNLPRKGPRPREVGKPASRLFFEADDRHHNFGVVEGFQTRLQSFGLDASPAF